MRLTDDGAAFLDHARTLLAANERALTAQSTPVRRLRLGISDHASGPELPELLGRLYASDPSLALDITVGFSSALLDTFDKGKLVGECFAAATAGFLPHDHAVELALVERVEQRA